MKIGIIGTRGIPNYYGGFEECAQQVGTRLVSRGHQVIVYNSHSHPFQQKNFEGVNIIHKYDPENRIGTFGQFIYDFNCILDARWRNFDIILMLGYTSSSIWHRFSPKNVALITNMDGLEWRRSKYSQRVQKFLKRAEGWAAKNSDVLIADAVEIQNYLISKYNQSQVIYIPYGASKFKNPNSDVLTKYNVQPGEYNLVVSRLEPENNIETILAGIQKSLAPKVTLVIGNHSTPYGEYLKNTFKDSRIRFINSIYEKDSINNLRHFSNIFFHGHSVGGTNPSLLEAMGSSSIICAHDNPFNREVLGDDATYFLDVNDVANAADLLERNDKQLQKIKSNLGKLNNKYNWDLVTDQYEVVFQQSLIRGQ